MASPAASSLARFLAELTDYERETRVRYDRTTFDLARMERLCERLGRPERRYPIAHVTGTKGKGSVSTMIAAILGARGLRTGLYTSPHLARLGERVAIDGRAASEDEMERAFRAIAPALEAMHAEGERFTFFEVTTALAFERFRAERVEAAVIEVGLGGRLDSTNVVRPAVTAITSIGLDHTDKLGTTLDAIAREKAGIAKAGVPLVLGALAPEAEAAAREVARARGAGPVLAAPGDLGAEPGTIAVSESGTVADLRLGGGRRLGAARLALVGRHQAENAAVAATAALLFAERAGLGALPEDALRRGLAAARIRARFEILGRVVIDGAHNPDSIAALVRAWRDVYGERRPVVVFGAMRDKDVPGMLARLAPLAAALVAAPCGSARETAPEELRALAAAAGLEADGAASAADALAAARRRAGAEGRILVCGSIYLAGLTLAALEAGDERRT